MKRSSVYSLSVLAIIAFLVWPFMQSQEEGGGSSEITKIALREVGNQLLLANQDSTSLILPVIELEESKFELSFENRLSFEPNTLVVIVKASFEKSGLPERYIVEVIQEEDSEVAYSYQMTESEQTTIIPCSGRTLPANHYNIQVMFDRQGPLSLSKNTISYVCAFSVILMSGFYLSRRKQAEETAANDSNKEGVMIGHFHFSAEQSKLANDTEDISLSRKECELFSIFVDNLNQVVTRDELTKRVWEDNGVIVGRSLDTYISKLRTKLKSDASVKLTNIHGLGYKLEWDEMV